MFVVAKDFDIAPYNLPKLQSNNSFQPYVDKLEEISMRVVFGDTLYEAFVAGIEALPDDWIGTKDYEIDEQVVYGSDIYKSLVHPNLNKIPGSDGAIWEVQPANRWLKLLAGESYLSDKNAAQKWFGMKELVKPLVFASWLRDSIMDTVTESGLTQSSTENSVVINPAVRFKDAWNDYAKQVGKLEFVEKNCLYRYLLANTLLFDDVVADIDNVNNFTDYLHQYFTNPGKVNLFDF